MSVSYMMCDSKLVCEEQKAYHQCHHTAYEHKCVALIKLSLVAQLTGNFAINLLAGL